MKTLKSKIVAGLSAMVFLFGLIYVVNAQGDSISKAIKTNSLTTETWYFVGDNPELPSSYSKTADPNKPCDSNPEVICTILAPEDPSNSNLPDLTADVPDQSQTVLEQIRDAVQHMSTNETVTNFRTE